MINKIIYNDFCDLYFRTYFSNNIVEYHMLDNICYLERFIDNKFYGIKFKKKIK